MGKAGVYVQNGDRKMPNGPEWLSPTEEMKLTLAGKKITGKENGTKNRDTSSILVGQKKKM